MKILVIASFAESILQLRGPLISEMASRGHEVHIAAPGLVPDSEIGQQMGVIGLSLHDLNIERVGMNPVADFKSTLAMYRLMRRIRPEVVLSYTVKPVIYGSIAAWLVRVPRRYTLITGLGYAFTGEATFLRGIVKMVVQNLYRLSLRCAHKVIFQNHDDQTLFRQLGLLQPGKPTLVVNGSGIDLATFTATQLPSGPMHFLLIARLLGDKGLREYARAAQCIKSIHPDVQFSLVGWIDDNPSAINQAELDAWLKSGVFNFYGRLQDVRPAIARCSVYVLPSYREGTPRTVLEAMAMGRPIITTDAPGCRETVVDGVNGFLVPVQSADALVQAMLRFVDDPSLAIRMGLRSRQLAEEKYDVHKVNAEMLHAMGL